MRFPVIALLTLVIGGIPVSASATIIALRFHGSADLSSFGGSPTSRYSGRVSWDTAMVPQREGGDYARYLIDGLESSVTATFSIDSVDYRGRIEPFSRFEQTQFDLFLQLFFRPLIDLDDGPAPDLRIVSLDLFGSPRPVFTHIDHLPDDLSFLPMLGHHTVGFFDASFATVAYANAMVAEPSSVTLLTLGLSLMWIWARPLGVGHVRFYRPRPRG